jgi:hypothetical protein
VRPPTDSMSRSTKPGPRVAVPLKSMCSAKCEKPRSAGNSSRPPTPTHKCSATTSLTRCSWTIRRMPLGSTSRTGPWEADGGLPEGALEQAEPKRVAAATMRAKPAPRRTFISMKPNRLDYPSQGWGDSLLRGARQTVWRNTPSSKPGRKPKRPRGLEEAPLSKWLIYKGVGSQSPMASLLHFVHAIRRKVRQSAVAEWR